VLNCEPPLSTLHHQSKNVANTGPVSGLNFFALAKTRRLDWAQSNTSPLRQLHKQSEHSLCALGTIINIKQITFFCARRNSQPVCVIYFGALSALKTALGHIAIWPLNTLTLFHAYWRRSQKTPSARSRLKLNSPFFSAGLNHVRSKKNAIQMRYVKYCACASVRSTW
jgi:hypothetical protein